MRIASRHPFATLAGILALSATTALAQGVYRHVGPDGRVTYSDQPPTAAAPPAERTPAAANGADLPYTLRQISQRYPVTFYSSTNCVPCDRGRDLLRARGIPFAEKTLTTDADLDAFQKLTGSSQLPHLTVGRQALIGFSPDQWTEYLDAAGYPKTSALPRTYRAPAPTALAPQAPAPAAPAAQEPAAATAPPAPEVPTGPTPQNPAGIRF